MADFHSVFAYSKITNRNLKNTSSNKTSIGSTLLMHRTACFLNVHYEQWICRWTQGCWGLVRCTNGLLPLSTTETFEFSWTDENKSNSCTFAFRSLCISVQSANSNPTAWQSLLRCSVDSCGEQYTSQTPHVLRITLPVLLWK
jgi:hypothetical protein